MPVRFRCGHCRQLMAISKRKIGSLVPCPTCQTMIEVPGVDMATVVGVDERRKMHEKESGQPLLEEDFDQVIAKVEGAPDEESPRQQASPVLPSSLNAKMIGIMVVTGAVLFLSGFVCGLLLARILGPTAG